MAEGIQVAWRLLEITALALPALAILVQVLMSMGDEYDKILNRYQTMTAAMLLIAPLSVTALVAIGVVLNSYQFDWLPWAAIPMATSFVLLPIFLLWRWRSRRQLFTDVFLEREKEIISREIENDNISNEDAENALREIKSLQEGLLWNFVNPEESAVVPIVNKVFAVGIIISGAFLLYVNQGLLVNAFVILVIVYSIVVLCGWSWTKLLSNLSKTTEES